MQGRLPTGSRRLARPMTFRALPCLPILGVMAAGVDLRLTRLDANCPKHLKTTLPGIAKLRKRAIQKRLHNWINCMTAKNVTQNPELTRKRLLHAATVEFSAKGLEGARILRIAKKAGTNVQAIYYHFGNKEQLYAATVEAMYDAERFETLSIELRELNPEEVILRVIDFMIVQYIDYATAYALLIDERQIDTAVQLKKLDSVRSLFARLLSQIDSALKQGAEAGIFRPDLDAVRVFMTITSLTGNYIHKTHTHSALFGRDFSSDAEFDGWCAHVGKLVLMGLRPLDREPRPIRFPRSLKPKRKRSAKPM